MRNLTLGSRFRLLLGVLGLLVLAGAGDHPSRLPIIDAGDVAALEEHFGKPPVIVTGTIASAQWSRTGKVMNIEFAGAQRSGLLAVVFENRRKQFDEAWAGDFITSVSGKRVRLYGQVNEYGGYQEAFKGRPQMILNSPEQVTLPEGLEQGEVLAAARRAAARASQTR